MSGGSLYGNGASDYLSSVSWGSVQNESSVSILGANASIGTGAEETVWEESSAYVFPTAASTMTVSSDDAADAFGSTGCTLMLIEGLDENWVEISDVIVMNGTTPVTTVNSYFRINFMTCIGSGTGLENAGNIFVGTGTVTAGKPANVYGRVSISEGISHTAVYSVPAGKRFLLVRGHASADSGKQINMFIDARPVAIGRTKVRGTDYDVTGQNVDIPFLPSEPYTEKTDIFVSAIAVGGGGAGELRVNLAGILRG